MTSGRTHDEALLIKYGRHPLQRVLFLQRCRQGFYPPVLWFLNQRQKPAIHLIKAVLVDAPYPARRAE